MKTILISTVAFILGGVSGIVTMCLVQIYPYLKAKNR